MAGPLAVMAFPWNSIFASGLFLVLIWFLFLTLPLPLDSCLALSVVVSSLSLSRRAIILTLLNVDYKIASRSISARLLKVLHSLVAKDQSCCVPGRFIGENVAFIRDVVDYCSLISTPAALISLDQEKAFGRVDWSFLRSVLISMGFGPSFVKWVDLFYCNSRSSVNVNGYISNSFPLSRGVQQGCPLSPLLYVLVVEVLACNIRANRSIRGLCLPGFSAPLPCVSLSAFHLNGKIGFPGGKPNGTGLSTGNFSKKREYLQRYSSFLVFTVPFASSH